MTENESGASADCAASAGAQVAREQATVRADITVADQWSELVRAGAIALNGGHERYAVDRWGGEVRCVLEGVLADRAVVNLPEPDGQREQLDGVLTYWNVDGWSVTVKEDMVSISTGPDGLGGGLGFRPEVAPRIVAALLAAVSRIQNREEQP